VSAFAALSIVMQLAIANVSPVMVDASLREAPNVWRETAAAFSDPRHGWVGTQGGGLFASTDGGETWTEIDPPTRGLPIHNLYTGTPSDALVQSPQIVKFVWRSPSVGLAFLNVGSSAYRTIDVGLHWTAVALPLADRFDRVERRGDHIWACSWSHRIIRSDDAGASFHEVSSPVAPRDQCDSMSFIDGQIGWLTDSTGRLFKTRDGGDTWSERPSPKIRASVFFLDEKTGWLTWEEGDPSSEDFVMLPKLVRTTNGGDTWSPVSMKGVRVDRFYVSTIQGRRIVTHNVAHSAADARPAIGEVFDGDGLVDVGGQLYKYGELVRATPVLARTGAPRLEALRGTSRLELHTARGWSNTHAYESIDHGKHWYVVGDLPMGTVDAAFFNLGRAISRTDRTLSVSGDGGRTWQASTKPAWDAYELGAATGRKTKSPIACVRDAERGELTIAFGQEGCFNHEESTLTLSWAGGAAHVVDARGKSASIPWSRARVLIEQLSAAAEAPDGPNECMSTSDSFAELQWSCDGAPTEKQAFYAGSCALPGKREADTRAFRLYSIGIALIHATP
jgi:photosystem II stability/assembly factor-like uncharacterized protein